jgi:hypothetical protein
MSAMRILAPLFAALLAVISLPCSAVPFSVRLGLEKVVLDTPPGFSDTTDLASPRLQDLAATLTSASNRVLIFGLTDADFRKFTLGDVAEFRRYLIAVTPKGLEQERVGTEQFARLVGDAMGVLGEPIKAPDLAKFLEKQPIGLVHLVAEIKKEPTLVSVVRAVRLPPIPGKKFYDSATPQYQLLSDTLVLVRGKALRLSVYTLYDSPEDAEWLRATTQRWMEELQRLNPR